MSTADPAGELAVAQRLLGQLAVATGSTGPTLAEHRAATRALAAIGLRIHVGLPLSPADRARLVEVLGAVCAIVGGQA